MLPVGDLVRRNAFSSPASMQLSAPACTDQGTHRRAMFQTRVDSPNYRTRIYFQSEAERRKVLLATGHSFGGYIASHLLVCGFSINT